MIDQKEAQRGPLQSQHKIMGIFKKYDLKVKILDKTNQFRSPDFLVTNSRKQSFLCECKYITSADTIENGKYQVSTLDNKFMNRSGNAFSYNSLDKPMKQIADAVQQYESLVKNESQYKAFPFVIALGFDFYADNFDLVPHDIYGFSQVSALIKIERDIEQRTELNQWSSEEIKLYIEGTLKKSMPPPSLRFRVLLNKKPQIKFTPENFLRNPIIT